MATAMHAAMPDKAQAQSAERGRLGLWLFFVSEVFLFGSLLLLRFSAWGATRPDLDQQLGLLVTGILLASSFFMNRAEIAIARDDRVNFIAGMAWTIILGIAFLIGVIGFEWRGEIQPGDGTFGAILFGMTGLHAFHVLSGVLLNVIILFRGLRGQFSADDHFTVEAAAIYWHFIDVVWVFFYPALYLMGTVVH